MLTRTFVAIGAGLALAVTTCSAITEAQLVGTWQPSCEGCFDIHGTPTIAFLADHTCIHKDFTNEGPTITRATWRVHGDELITRFAKDAVMHEFVLSVSADEFKTRSGGQIFTYTRVKTKP